MVRPVDMEGLALGAARPGDRVVHDERTSRDSIHQGSAAARSNPSAGSTAVDDNKRA